MQISRHVTHYTCHLLSGPLDVVLPETQVEYVVVQSGRDQV